MQTNFLTELDTINNAKERKFTKEKKSYRYTESLWRWMILCSISLCIHQMCAL